MLWLSKDGWMHNGIHKVTAYFPAKVALISLPLQNNRGQCRMI